MKNSLKALAVTIFSYYLFEILNIPSNWAIGIVAGAAAYVLFDIEKKTLDLEQKIYGSREK